jgi:hypothetical protein
MENGIIGWDSSLPFHGIISRGLLRSFIENELNYETWCNYAPDPELYGPLSESSPSEFQMIQNLIRQHGVLSFYQSAVGAKEYGAIYCRSKKEKITHMDCWNIKEGHTSSVWKISIYGDNISETFIVNVARDCEAGMELRESSLKLKAVKEQSPDINSASVFDISTIHNKLLPGGVVVTRNEWIENAFEVHLRTNKQEGREELLMVDRFLMDVRNPAKIISILGRIFSSEEANKIKSDLQDFLLNASEYLHDEVAVNINDGDLVWNGERAIVVAIS